MTKYDGVTNLDIRFIKDHDYCILCLNNKFVYDILINGGNEKPHMSICMFMRSRTNVVGVNCDQSLFSDLSYVFIQKSLVLMQIVFQCGK